MFQNLSKATTKPEQTPLSPLKVLMWTLTLILSWTHRYSSPKGLPSHTETRHTLLVEFSWSTQRFLQKCQRLDQRLNAQCREIWHASAQETPWKNSWNIFSSSILDKSIIIAQFLWHETNRIHEVMVKLLSVLHLQHWGYGMSRTFQ